MKRRDFLKLLISGVSGVLANPITKHVSTGEIAPTSVIGDIANLQSGEPIHPDSIDSARYVHTWNFYNRQDRPVYFVTYRGHKIELRDISSELEYGIATLQADEFTAPIPGQTFDLFLNPDGSIDSVSRDET